MADAVCAAGQASKAVIVVGITTMTLPAITTADIRRRFITADVTRAEACSAAFFAHHSRARRHAVSGRRITVHATGRLPNRVRVRIRAANFYGPVVLAGRSARPRPVATITIASLARSVRLIGLTTTSQTFIISAIAARAETRSAVITDGRVYFRVSTKAFGFHSFNSRHHIFVPVKAGTKVGYATQVFHAVAFLTADTTTKAIRRTAAAITTEGDVHAGRRLRCLFEGCSFADDSLAKSCVKKSCIKKNGKLKEFNSPAIVLF